MVEGDAAKATRGTVFVVDGDRALARQVTLAETRDADRRVSDGLAPGAVVVLEPGTLADGDRVTVAKAPAR